MQKLRKRLTLTLILAGRVRKHYTHALMAMLATAIFDRLFFIKSNISAMGRLFVVKFHTNIANRWLLMIEKENNGYHSLFIKLFD